VVREDAVILVGMRASGKTTLGRALATTLSWRFLDGDLAVLERTGRSAAAWLRESGEPSFREVEERITLELLATRGAFVAALGGGAILSPSVRAALAGFRHVVWLTAPADELARRSRAGTGDRPPLTRLPHASETDEVLRERSPLYDEVSTVRLNTTGGNVDDCMARLLAGLGIRT
jgi:shikimate kinase